jgi:hypothetical protein
MISRANMPKQIANPPGKKKAAVKMQKGGMVPCKGCKSPAACKKAGSCMLKG